MSEQGVPIDEVTAGDFIHVRAALVKRVGGGNEAIVWARIEFRCRPDSPVAYEHETSRWWRARYAAIAEETGLSEKQARGAVEGLVRSGFVVREQHSLRNNYDQTYSYRPVVIAGQIDVPDRADESAQEGTSGLPDWADAPSTEEAEKVTTKNVEAARAETVGQRFAQPLCDVLMAELSRNGVKASVSKRWLDDARLLVDRDERDPREAKTLIEWACRDSFWRANILSMPTFRKQFDKLRLARERGGVRVPTVEHGRQVDEILRARAAAGDLRKAIAS